MSPERTAPLRIVLCSDRTTSTAFALVALELGVRELALADLSRASLQAGDVDLIVVDVATITAADGALRARPPGLPILIVTAEGDERDRARLLLDGADDVMPLGVGARELAARCQARARAARGQPGLEARRVEVGGLALDLDRRRAFVGQMELRLTSFELDLLAELARHVGAVVHRARLSLVLTGHGGCTSLNVHVSHLRQKLDAAQARLRIRSVRNVGYRLDGTSGAEG